MMAWMRWRKGWKRAAMTSVETTIATALFWWNIPWNSDCKAKMRPKYSRASRAVKLPYTSVRLISTSISYSRYRKIENPMESGIRRKAMGQTVIKNIAVPKLFDAALGEMKEPMAKMPMATTTPAATPKIIHFVCWRWTGVDTRL